MQKILSLFVLLLLTTAALSQAKTLSTDPTKWSMDDMKKLAAMSPAEQEAFKKKMIEAADNQLKKTAKTHNITIDESRLQ
ncbi:MAG TPA: hypothetical protein VMR70_15240, partial [Flavisolibacter sp.]|nr:hypothetical protein [Flavisolibacter sp.]